MDANMVAQLLAKFLFSGCFPSTTPHKYVNIYLLIINSVDAFPFGPPSLSIMPGDFASYGVSRLEVILRLMATGG
jgi:hypothetical protein